MEAFRTPNGKYVAEQYSIVYSPGGDAEMRLRQPRILNRSRPAVLVQASQQFTLPGEEIEREAILKAFPRTKIIDVGKMPWRAVLKEIAAADFAHFLGHGEQEGQGTVLFLGQGHRGRVRAKDLSSPYLRHLQLAVLAACSTGVGGENGLLDSGNLIRAFIVAGVPNVLASRWNVDSVSTAQLLRIFYMRLDSGEKAPDALHGAQREYISAMRHPYFWAGFNVTGRKS
jgi:CHAT domain-containing protein